MNDSPYIELSWELNGMEADATGGIHIHTGTSCEEASLVGGHLYDDAVTDPWIPTKWTSDSNGKAKGSFRIDGLDGLSFNQNVGRAVVVHDSNGARVACAVLGSREGDVECADDRAGCIGGYPGYAGDLSLGGQVKLSGSMNDSPYIELSWELNGMEADATGGIHIHTGTSCEDASLVGGHLYDDAVTDPWIPTKWTSDSNGSAKGSFRIDGLDGLSFNQNVGRAVVVHDSNSARVACAVLGSRDSDVE